MIWIIIPIAAVVIMSIFTMMNNRNTKDYYLNQQDEIKEESETLKQKVLEMIKTEQPNLEHTIIVNGHFTKQMSAGIKVTTFYSYAMLFHEQTKQVQVIAYNPDKKTAQNIGYFPIGQIDVSDVGNGFQTNYICKDTDGKTVVTVQTLGHELPSENEYQIKYFQEDYYNALRGVFSLPPYFHAEVLGGTKS